VETRTHFNKRGLLYPSGALNFNKVKHILFYSKIPLIVCLAALLAAPFNLQGQSVKRQSVSSYGPSGPGIPALEQTAGQPFGTLACGEITTPLRQGFQQPLWSKNVTMQPGIPDELHLSLHPNPSEGPVQLNIAEEPEYMEIKVLDCNGRQVLSKDGPWPGSLNFNCSQWAEGVYFIIVTDRNKRIGTSKLIINK